MNKTFDEIFVELDQIGIVLPVQEAENKKNNLVELFEIPADKIRGGNIIANNNAYYKGKMYPKGGSKRLDFFNKFPIELEYLSPVEGDSVLMDYYKKAHMGIHHIRFNVSSYDDAVEYMKEHGIELVEYADSLQGEGIKYAYFDTYDKIGFYIEIINFAEAEKKK